MIQSLIELILIIIGLLILTQFLAALLGPLFIPVIGIIVILYLLIKFAKAFFK